MGASITCGAQVFCKMLALGWVCCMCVMSVSCREPELRTRASTLRLRTLAGCAPEPAPQLVVEALGDFPPDARSLVASRIDSEPVVLSDLPVAAQWFRLSVETESFRGAALGRAGNAGEKFDALLLPFGRACSSIDASLPILPGSALSLVSGSDLLIAGGLRESSGSSDAWLVRIAEGAQDSVEQLFSARVGARAVSHGDETWLLGGVQDLRDGSVAFSTFDRFVAASRAFALPGRLRVGRYRAAAVTLLDGSVLVAGGTASVAGEPLASLETIAAGGTSSSLWQRALPFRAPELSLHALDDGSVVALGQLDAEAQELALLDPGSRDVRELVPPALSKDAHLTGSLTAALPGARLALLELSGAGSEVSDAWQTTGQLHLLLANGDFLTLSDWLGSFAGLSQARALALRDGRILVTGTREGQPTARILNLNNREVALRTLDLSIDALFMREDGSVLLVGMEGLRVLREDALTPFDNPGGTLIADDSGALCLEAYGRFAREGLGLRALAPGARFDLAPLRFQDAEIELTVEGRVELLLRREDGQERSIEVGEQKLGPAFCQLDANAAAGVQIVREGERVTLRAGGQTRSCRLDGLTGAVAIGVSALDADTLVRDLRVQRR